MKTTILILFACLLSACATLRPGPELPYRAVPGGKYAIQCPGSSPDGYCLQQAQRICSKHAIVQFNDDLGIAVFGDTSRAYIIVECLNLGR